jgi:tRNA(fMet)-specific endonuclease VapC
MRYLLDSNAVIAMLKDSNSRVANRARAHRVQDIALSSVVVHELFYGAFKSRHPGRNAGFIDGIAFAVLDFDKEDARHAGELRAFLTVRGTAIGPYDVLIAGQAVARSMILVTNNVREFSRVPGLAIEDWQRD